MASWAAMVGYRADQPDRKEDRRQRQREQNRGTDYIGKLGVEQSFEQQLHGTTGWSKSRRRSAAAVRATCLPTRPTGNTVMLSLDIKPQKLVEDMFGDRRGALVALDPRSGDVPFVSKPTFDPNLFVDGLTPKLEGAERVHRQTPSQPNCAAPTRLAYKALHGHGRAANRQTRSGAVISDNAPTRSAATFAATATSPGLGRHVQVHRQVQQRVLLLAGQ
jgi:cell division protein FtsI/penicillin-binding protein 2